LLRWRRLGWPRRSRLLLLLSLLLAGLLHLKTRAAGISELQRLNDTIPALCGVRRSSSWATMALHMCALWACCIIPELIEIALVDPEFS